MDPGAMPHGVTGSDAARQDGHGPLAALIGLAKAECIQWSTYRQTGVNAGGSIEAL